MNYRSTARKLAVGILLTATLGVGSLAHAQGLLPSSPSPATPSPSASPAASPSPAPATSPTAQPGSQAASSYQYPCASYSLSGYNFPQWVSGPLSGYHVGQDVGCWGSGGPLYAIAEGTVVYSAKTPDSYRWGNMVIIQHTNPDGSQLVSIYGHMSGDRRVAAGQTVTKGQLVGFVGASWTADNGNWGAHLHFGLRVGAYGAAIGTYSSNIKGYVGASEISSYINPEIYIRDRLGGPVGGPAPAPPPPVKTWAHENVAVEVNGDTNGKNAEYYVDFKLKNTGNVTWENSGDRPVRLGTINPRDRGSGFSAGMLGQGWVSPSRIYLMANTAPGQVGTFRGRFSNRQVPAGFYAERFAPLVEGQGWMADKGLVVGLNVPPPRYTAGYAGQGAYQNLSPTNTAGNVDSTYLLPGQRLNLKAYLKNTGDVPWNRNGPNPVRLGTSRPNDRGSGFATVGDGALGGENWLSPSRASELDGRLDGGTVTPTDTVNPGETAVFSFTITVPSAPGDYAEYFNVVAEGKTWMNDLGLYFRLRVLPPGFHYEYAGQANPAALPLGGSGAQTSVLLRNTGQEQWPVGGNVRLGTDRLRDRASGFKGSDWLGANRPSGIDANVINPGKPTIGPGEIAKFSFNLDNPSATDGAYPEHFRPVVEGSGWMPEDYGIYVPVNVQSPALGYQVSKQEFSKPAGNLKIGDELTATLAVRNVGSRPWATGGANPVRLGTSRPNDRGSGFAMLSGGDQWLNPTRASGIDGKVTSLATGASAPAAEIRQGETAIFNIPLKIPALNPGAYPEYFNLVAEGQGWFPDLGIYFPLNVTGLTGSL